MLDAMVFKEINEKKNSNTKFLQANDIHMFIPHLKAVILTLICYIHLSVSLDRYVVYIQSPKYFKALLYDNAFHRNP